MVYVISYFFFFFNDTATTEIYTLSLHDALPISLQRRHHDLRTERGGGETDGNFTDDVIALAGEGRMRRDMDQHIEVAGRAAGLPRLALVRQAQPGARLDAGGNVHV